MSLSDYRDAAEAVADLCRGFFPESIGPLSFEIISADQLDVGNWELLAHDRHMTPTLAEHHGCPLRLEVLASRTDPDDVYRRKIQLVRTDNDNPVELGLVRIDLNAFATPVANEIRAQRAPLGMILMQHDVVRRIEPRWHVRVPGAAPHLESLGGRAEPLYGRIGRIYCNDVPAIDALEIVMTNSDHGE